MESIQNCTLNHVVNWLYIGLYNAILIEFNNCKKKKDTIINKFLLSLNKIKTFKSYTNEVSSSHKRFDVYFQG